MIASGDLAGSLILVLVGGLVHLVLGVVTLVLLLQDWRGDVRRLRRLAWLWAAVAVLALLGALLVLSPAPTEGRLLGVPVIWGSRATPWSLLLVPLPAAVVALLLGWAAGAPRSSLPRILLLVALLSPAMVAAVTVATEPRRVADGEQELARARAELEALERAESVIDAALHDLGARTIVPDPDDGVGPVDLCGRLVPRDEKWLTSAAPTRIPTGPCATWGRCEGFAPSIWATSK